ncbi:hypothetical protein UlMin_043530 [Ulmus minor]
MNNPPAPILNSSFNFHPSNPNPNWKFENRVPQPPPPDLSATLASLNNLIHQSDQILHSLSTILPLQNPNLNRSNGFVSCPFNPHHKMDPNSLFAHSLHCHSSPYFQDQELLSSLNYPKNLKTAEQCQAESSFLQTLNGSESELCFSLENFYANFGSNYFYKDCPGVVNLSALDGINRTFTLPAVLSEECVDFVRNGDSEKKGSEGESWKILPSELWAIRAEVEAWNEYPGAYSFRVLRAILGLDMARESELAGWVIANSPRYGIVIDVAMRDHVFLLCRLCLKAIIREACSLADNRDSEKVLGIASFNCPILVQVLRWLASQLAILYGEMNGKFFAINILKQCILQAASSFLIFPAVQKMTESPALEEDVNDDDNPMVVEVKNPLRISTNREGHRIGEESVTSGLIFASQVAAAVAALHERSLLEGKIRALSVPRPLNRYQRSTEHDYMWQRAVEERKKRPQYRPIIEHDGLPRQQLNNEETSKSKTREELLAEERDYKRRRMSYRGKKVKRNTLQVMRDIIEDFMDEIKQAGGIGCFEKGSAREGTLPSKSSYVSDITTDVDMPERSNYDSCTAGDNRRKQSRSDYSTQSTTSRDASDKYYDQPRRGHHSNLDYPEDQNHRSARRDKHGKEYYSRSSTHVHSNERNRPRREKDELGATGTKYNHTKRESSSRDRSYSSSRSNSHHELKVGERWQRDRYESQSSDSIAQNTFDDRYDPSDSHDKYDDDDVY